MTIPLRLCVLACTIFYCYAVSTSPKHSEILSKPSGIRELPPPKSFIPPPPPPPKPYNKYVDFELKPQSSRYGYGKGDSYSHSAHGTHNVPQHHGNYYPHHDYHSLQHGKEFDFLYMLPLILAGLGLVLLPSLALLLTLFVNIAPASTIPTAVATATGKKVGAPSLADTILNLIGKVEEALEKYDKKV